MKAAVYHGPWSLQIEDVPAPDVGEGEILIDVLATGICGSDVHGYTGETGRRAVGQIMGHETVGRIAEVGKPIPYGTLVTFDPVVWCGRCARCHAGDTQACVRGIVVGVDPTLPGSFAQLLKIPLRNVVPLAGLANPLHGALVEPLAVGYHAVLRGKPRADDATLIIGGGPIGQATAIGARRQGLTRLLVSEPLADRRVLLERLGFATTTPDQVESDFLDQFGEPPTLVIDAVGISATLRSALSASAGQSRLVLVGMGAPRVDLRPFDLTVAERNVSGSYCYRHDELVSTAAWVADGRPELDLLIDDATYWLDDAPAAFQAVSRGPKATKSLILAGS